MKNIATNIEWMKYIISFWLGGEMELMKHTNWWEEI